MEDIKMKPSGIAWVGNIPKHWEVKKGKYFLRYLQKPVKDTDDVITCFRDGEVTLRSNRREDGFTVSLKEIGYQGIDVGDLVVHGMDGFAGAIGISDSRGKASPVLNVLDTDNNKRYIMYYLRNMAYNGVFIALATGIRVRTCDTGWNKLRELPYLLPPKNEQNEIADYIDTKCTEIDSLVADIQSQIDTLEEYKKSVITEAVTHGLNPNVGMKHSGIEFVDQIPEHWLSNKMNRICEIITDYVASGSFEDLAKNVTYLDYPDFAMLVRTADVSGKAHTSQPVYIDEKSYNFLKNSNLYGGEIVLPNIGASVGDVYIVPKLYERMSLAPNSIMIKTKQVDKYFYYFFMSSAGRKNLIDISGAAAQAKFNKTDLRQMKVPQPPLQEQQEIVDYLDEKCAEVEVIIADKKAQLETLADYKKSLIYEYVTGKKQVKENA